MCDCPVRAAQAVERRPKLDQRAWLGAAERIDGQLRCLRAEVGAVRYLQRERREDVYERACPAIVQVSARRMLLADG